MMIELGQTTWEIVFELDFVRDMLKLQAVGDIAFVVIHDAGGLLKTDVDET